MEGFTIFHLQFSCTLRRWEKTHFSRLGSHSNLCALSLEPNSICPLFKFCSVLAKHHLLVQREKEGFVKLEKLTGHWSALQQLYHSQLKENGIKHMGDIFLITCGCKINRIMHSSSYLGFIKTSIMPKICLCSLAFSKLVFLFLFCHHHLLLYFEEMFI